MAEDTGDASANVAGRTLKQRLERAGELAGFGIWEVDLVNSRTDWSSNVFRIYGYEPDAFVPTYGSLLEGFDADTRHVVESAVQDAIATGSPFACDAVIVQPSGALRSVYVEGAVDALDDGTATGLSGILLDRTRLKNQEMKLAKAARIEGLGEVAGGVAHDLNNHLAVILGNLEFLEEWAATDREQSKISSALKATLACAELVQKMQGYLRKAPAAAKPVDLKETIEGFLPLVAQALPKTCALRFTASAGQPVVVCDAKALEDALMELVLNSRDALPDGGAIAIDISLVHLDDAARQGLKAEVPPGDYVVVSVTDDGAGMAPDQLARAEEAFFTTKEIGKAAGLGLSRVVDLAEQSRGFFRLSSERGAGTTARLFLPQADQA